MSKPTILITNDDGINAKGLRYLISVMRKLGDVTVVASEFPMSATSHSITVRSPLRLEKIIEEDGYREYQCNGTPVDCMKLGEQVVLRKKPDLLVSGVNHGSNASVNVVYSGTMAAVIEGCISGIPSIGFSLLDYSSKADFSACGNFINEITGKVLKEGLPQGVCLNVNIPAIKAEEINGIKICRQSKARWVEEFDVRKDPREKDYFWLTGYFEKLDNEPDTDQWALENHYVSVVPTQFDFTAHKEIATIKKWQLNGKSIK
ncbi:MAG: 5'/3'-nucleotidase SurE [Bacteroidetes bacterium]|nr:5'/3'-nucleotidase SurE [Bacteroidota bacterium]